MIHLIISDAISNFGSFHLLLRQITNELKNESACIHFPYFSKNSFNLRNISYFCDFFWFGYEVDGARTHIYKYIQENKYYNEFSIGVCLPHQTVFRSGSLLGLIEECRAGKICRPKIYQYEKFKYQNTDIFSGYIPDFAFEELENDSKVVYDGDLDLTNDSNNIFAELLNKKDKSHLFVSDSVFFIGENKDNSVASSVKLKTDALMIDK